MYKVLYELWSRLAKNMLNDQLVSLFRCSPLWSHPAFLFCKKNIYLKKFQVDHA